MDSSSRARPPERSYPKMRALLSDPDSVPYGSEPLARAVPPPGARAFFRAPIKPRARTTTEEQIDSMLEEMAESLLVGGTGAGLEFRITLKDDFFAGTELRIYMEDLEIRASFAPPDYATFRQLSKEVDRLRSHLEQLGLRVGRIEVKNP